MASPVSLLCVLLAACAPDAEPPATAVDTAEGSSTLGAEGGSIALADGTSFVVPVGALREPVSLAITEVDPVADAHVRAVEDGGAGWLAAGPAFRIDPPMTGVVNFQITLPLAGASGDPSTVVLVASAPGIIDHRGDGEEPAEGLVHPALSPVALDGETATFEVGAVGAVIFQALTAPTAGSGGGPVPPPSFWGGECSDYLEDWFGPPGADLGLEDWSPVDDLVDLNDTSGAHVDNLRLSWAAAGLDTGPIDEAQKAIRARTCLAVWRTAQRALFDTDDPYNMGMPWPLDDWEDDEPEPKRLPVTLQWWHEGCTAPGVGGSVWASANGYGLSVNLARGCEAASSPYLMSTPDWNDVTGGADPDHADQLEATLAHELFHYLERWADLEPDAAIVIDDPDGGPADDSEAWVEGAADGFMERIYDQVPGFAFQPLAIWMNPGCSPASTVMWDAKYRVNPLWRYLDHTQEDIEADGSVYARALGRVQSEAFREDCPGAGCVTDNISLEDLDELTAEMYPSRSEMDLGVAFADFVADYLLLHEFEGGATGVGSDHFPDVLGETHAETESGDLWDDLPTGCGATSAAAGTPTLPAISVPTITSLPAVHDESIDHWRAAIVELDVSPLRSFPSPILRLTLDGSVTNDISDEMHARVFWEDAGDATLLGRIDGGGSQSVLVPSQYVDGGTLYVILSNTDDSGTQGTIRVNVDAVTQLGFAMSTDGLVGLDLERAGTVPVCDDPAAEPPLLANYRGDVTQIFVPFEGLAVAYPFQHEVRLYDQGTCAEVGVLTGGPIAHALSLELTMTGDLMVVGSGAYSDPCAGGSISVVDMVTDTVLNEVALPIGVHDMALASSWDGSVAVVAPAGDFSCPGSEVYFVDVEGLAAASSSAEIASAVWSTPAGGMPTGQIAASKTGRFVAWTVDSDPGVVGLHDLDTGTQWVGTPDQDGDGMWPLADVDVLDHGDGSARVYFLVERLYDTDNYDAGSCIGSVTCGALRWFDLTVGASGQVLAGQWQLPEPHPVRLGVFEAGFALVGHNGHDQFTVVDLGTHTGGVQGLSVLDAIESPVVISAR